MTRTKQAARKGGRVRPQWMQPLPQEPQHSVDFAQPNTAAPAALLTAAPSTAAAAVASPATSLQPILPPRIPVVAQPIVPQRQAISSALPATTAPKPVAPSTKQVEEDADPDVVDDLAASVSDDDEVDDPSRFTVLERCLEGGHLYYLIRRPRQDAIWYVSTHDDAPDEAEAFRVFEHKQAKKVARFQLHETRRIKDEQAEREDELEIEKQTKQEEEAKKQTKLELSAPLPTSTLLTSTAAASLPPLLPVISLSAFDAPLPAPSSTTPPTPTVPLLPPMRSPVRTRSHDEEEGDVEDEEEGDHDEDFNMVPLEFHHNDEIDLTNGPLQPQHEQEEKKSYERKEEREEKSAIRPGVQHDHSIMRDDGDDVMPTLSPAGRRSPLRSPQPPRPIFSIAQSSPQQLEFAADAAASSSSTIVPLTASSSSTTSAATLSVVTSSPGAICSICNSSSLPPWSSSPLPPKRAARVLTCHTCGIHVHVACYGVLIPPLRDSYWWCAVCDRSGYQRHELPGGLASKETHGRDEERKAAKRLGKAALEKFDSEICFQQQHIFDARQMPCMICTHVGGALMPIQFEFNYIHVLCALFLPKSLLARWSPPPMRWLYIEKELTSRETRGRGKAHITCQLCKRERFNYCTNCATSGCPNRVHPTCAQENGCKIDAYYDAKSDQWIHELFCLKHSREQREDGDRKEKQRATMMTTTATTKVKPYPHSIMEEVKQATATAEDTVTKPVESGNVAAATAIAEVDDEVFTRRRIRRPKRLMDSDEEDDTPMLPASAAAAAASSAASEPDTPVKKPTRKRKQIVVSSSSSSDSTSSSASGSSSSNSSSASDSDDSHDTTQRKRDRREKQRAKLASEKQKKERVDGKGSRKTVRKEKKPKKSKHRDEEDDESYEDDSDDESDESIDDVGGSSDSDDDDPKSKSKSARKKQRRERNEAKKEKKNGGGPKKKKQRRSDSASSIEDSDESTDHSHDSDEEEFLAEEEWQQRSLLQPGQQPPFKPDYPGQTQYQQDRLRFREKQRKRREAKALRRALEPVKDINVTASTLTSAAAASTSTSTPTAAASASSSSSRPISTRLPSDYAKRVIKSIYIAKTVHQQRLLLDQIWSMDARHALERPKGHRNLTKIERCLLFFHMHRVLTRPTPIEVMLSWITTNPLYQVDLHTTIKTAASTDPVHAYVALCSVLIQVLGLSFRSWNRAVNMSPSRKNHSPYTGLEETTRLALQEAHQQQEVTLRTIIDHLLSSRGPHNSHLTTAASRLRTAMDETLNVKFNGAVYPLKLEEAQAIKAELEQQQLAVAAKSDSSSPVPTPAATSSSAAVAAASSTSAIPDVKPSVSPSTSTASFRFFVPRDIPFDMSATERAVLRKEANAREAAYLSTLNKADQQTWYDERRQHRLEMKMKLKEWRKTQSPITIEKQKAENKLAKQKRKEEMEMVRKAGKKEKKAAKLTAAAAASTWNGTSAPPTIPPAGPSVGKNKLQCRMTARPYRAAAPTTFPNLQPQQPSKQSSKEPQHQQPQQTYPPPINSLTPKAPSITNSTLAMAFPQDFPSRHPTAPAISSSLFVPPSYISNSQQMPSLSTSSSSASATSSSSSYLPPNSRVAMTQPTQTIENSQSSSQQYQLDSTAAFDYSSFNEPYPSADSSVGMSMSFNDNEMNRMDWQEKAHQHSVSSLDFDDEMPPLER